MSARRWFGGALLLAALGMTGAARPSGTGTIVARVGGNLAGRAGDTLNVPITVDMRGSGGLRLGGYQLTVRFNPNVLWFQSGSDGTFASPLVNTDSLGYGVLRMTAILPAGADSVVTLGVGHFVVQSDTGSSGIDVAFQAMSGVAPTFDDLLPMLTVVNGTFCHAAGKWGDVDGDGAANSRDALIALSRVVGLTLDTASVVEYRDTAGVLIYADTIVNMRPGLADVDGDGQVTSRDALIIVSYAVGLPVSGYRIGLAAAGSCGSGLGVTLAIAPDTLELVSGQTANVVVSGRDGGGDPIALSGATWTSASPAVAQAVSPGFGIEARDPGTAVLTVQLGAGYRASMVVKVLAHRTQWFVDVAHSQAALQTGSAAYPFAYIQGAFDWAFDGDTINVAPGTYEEAVGASVSVLLRGDPVNLPVLDPRGAYSYYPSNPALNVGSRAAPMGIENLRVLYGQVAVYAHGFVARNLHIEGNSSIYEPLYVEGAIGLPAGSAPNGPHLDSGLPGDTGSVLLDSVTVHNYGDEEFGNGIRIAVADTVIIRNSAVTRDSTFFPACGGDGTAGIYVTDAFRTEITHTTVLSAPCAGMGVLSSKGSVLFSHNTVDRAGGVGIVASVPHIETDHNTITRIISGSWSAKAGGIVIFPEVQAQTVTSVGDVIRGMGDAGFVVANAVSTTIDSLTVDTAGLDGTYSAAGVDFFGGRLRLTNSIIRHINSTSGEAVGVLAWTPDDTTRSVLESRHNRIEDVTAQGLYASSWSEGGSGGGCAPAVQPGIANGCAPAIQRGAMNYGYRGPDSLISVGDSILFAGNGAILAEYGKVVLIDSATVDSTWGSATLYFTNVHAATVAHSRILHSLGTTAIYAEYVDSLHVTSTAVRGTANGGISSAYASFTDLVGNTVDSAAGDGIFVYQTSGAPTLLVDSNRVSASGQNGLSLYCSFCTGTGTLTRNSFTGNAAVGIYDDGYVGGFNLTAHRNTIAGNVAGGARLAPAVIGSVVMNADTNFWGDQYGPTCDSVIAGVTGCDPLAVLGDSVLSQGISFAGWLTTPAPDVMLAPRFRQAPARRPVPAAVAAARPARPAGVGAPRPFALARPELQPRPQIITWRRGQPARPARVRRGAP